MRGLKYVLSHYTLTLRAPLVAAVGLLCCASASGNLHTWSGKSGPPTPFPLNSNWSNPGNWVNFSTPASSTSTDIIFGTSPALSPNQDFGDEFQVRSLNFDVSGYTVGGGFLKFDVPGSIYTNTGTATINNGLRINSTVTINGAGSLSLTGFINGPASFIKEGSGTLTISSAQVGGGAQINGGQIKLDSAVALNRGPITINVNDGLNLNGLPSVDIFSLAGTGSLNLGSSVMHLHGGSFGGAITGTGSVIKGANDITFTGVGSSYNKLEVPVGGVTLTNGGTLALKAGINALLVGTGAGGASSMTVSGGAILDTRLAGTVRIGNHPDSIATMTVTGAGSRWRSNDTQVGLSGPGNLAVSDGGAISDGSALIVGSAPLSTATVSSGGSINVNSMILGGSPTTFGQLNLSGAGSSVTTSFLRISQSAVPGGDINVQNATLSTGFLLGGDVSLVNISDPVGGAALRFTGDTDSQDYPGAIRGSGSIAKSGSGTQTLSGENAWLGSTTVEGGNLILASQAASSAYVANGGTLELRFANLGFSSARASSTGTIKYNSPLIVGGFLRGHGNHDISGVSSFNGTTLGADTSITQSNPLTFHNVTNSGALTSNNTLEWDAGSNSAAGAFQVNQTASLGSFENFGHITINEGGLLNSTSSDLVSGGGSRIELMRGGRLNVKGQTLQLNGALLINNGTVDGSTYVNFGSLAKGSGRYGEVIVTDGGKFSPGNSPGTVSTGSTTWNSGGSYLVEVADALNDDRRDMWMVDGQLNVDASGKPFTVSLASIDGLIFDNTRDYTWPILHADDRIVGVDPSRIVLDASGFKNDLGAGHFFLASTSTDLVVHFSAVPEPTAMGALLAGILLTKRRVRRCSTDSQGEVT